MTVREERAIQQMVDRALGIQRRQGFASAEERLIALGDGYHWSRPEAMVAAGVIQDPVTLDPIFMAGFSPVDAGEPYA